MNRPLMITGLFAGTMGLAATAQAQAQAQDCDAILVLHDVRSAGVLAQADRFILENGYGCDAETVAGDTVPTTTSMVEMGEPDVSPETRVDLCPRSSRRASRKARSSLGPRPCRTAAYRAGAFRSIWPVAAKIEAAL